MAVLAGSAVGIVETLTALAFAAVVFGGAIDYRLAEGIGLYLGASALTLALFAWRVGTRGIIGGPQALIVALLAIVAATTGVRARGSPHEGFLSVVAAGVVVTVLCGAVFLWLGARRRGDLVRHVPVPVVGGIVAGAGWVLLQAGIHVAIDEPLFYTDLAEIADGEVARSWLPAVGFGAMLLLVARRIRSPFAVPATIGIGLAAFWLVAVATGSTLEDVHRGGWLFSGVDEELVWQPWSVTALAQADWLAVARSWPAILAAALVAAPATLLALARTEAVLERDLDTDAELRDAGVANVVVGLAGGVPGVHAVGHTSMAERLHVDGRTAGLVAAIVPLAALLVGATALELVPRPIAGGLVVFLGLSFIVEWVWDRRATLPRIEYAVVLVILAAVVLQGLLAGIVVGLVLAVGLFAVHYGRLDLLHEVPFGDVYRSNVDRPPAERDRLRALGDAVQIVRVSGHLFFGSTNRLLDRIRSRADGPAPPRFVVIDLGRVTGVDASVVATLAKVERVTSPHGIEIVLAGASAPVRARIERAAVLGNQGVVTFTPDLEAGLRHVEASLLADPTVADGIATPDGIPEGMPAGLGPYLERVVLDAGAVLLREGEPPGDIYVLTEGRLAVETTAHDGARLRVRTLRPGVVVGEVALYTGEARTADVVAETPCVVLACSRERLAQLEADDPDLAAELHRWIAATLAARLSDSMRAFDALLG